MTAKQLEHLAELSAFAEDFYRRTNPAVARRFRDTAATATRLGKEMARAEERTRLQREVTQLRAEAFGPAVA
jgi:hypothetical protein